MTEAASGGELLSEAQAFAQSLTNRIKAIFDTAATFTAFKLSGKRVGVGVMTEGDDGIAVFDRIALTADGIPVLDLLLKFHCCWDHLTHFLATEEAWLHVFPHGKEEPLFRYEYVRGATGNVPVSHIQVHAHRDEITYLMLYSDKVRPKEHWRRREAPKLSKLHFPTGGHRFRPCIEDLLHTLIYEFGLDARENWRNAVCEGRKQWRRIQLRAAVRDTPEEAATTLRRLGYDVAWPEAEPPPNDQLDRLEAF